MSIVGKEIRLFGVIRDKVFVVLDSQFCQETNDFVFLVVDDNGFISKVHREDVIRVQLFHPDLPPPDRDVAGMVGHPLIVTRTKIYDRIAGYESRMEKGQIIRWNALTGMAILRNASDTSNVSMLTIKQVEENIATGDLKLYGIHE